jgi:hypothetical protein
MTDTSMSNSNNDMMSNFSMNSKLSFDNENESKFSLNSGDLFSEHSSKLSLNDNNNESELSIMKN